MNHFRVALAALIVTLFACISTEPAAAVQLCNKAWVNIDSTGTADPITLGSAVSGNQTLAACGITDGQVVSYSILDGAAFEVGTGTYTASGTTLTRNVIESSNSDTEIDLTATATLLITPLSKDLPSETIPTEASPAAADYLFILQSGVFERSQVSAFESALEGFLDLADLQGSLTLAGDVDGAHGSNDLDEAAVETELEGVLDAADLQGDIALTTDTSGNYVLDVADGTGIDGTASGEGATYTPSFDATEISSMTWGSSNFTSETFSTDGIDLAWNYTTIDGVAILATTGGTVPALAIDDQGTIRWYEEDGGGANYKAFDAPAAITTTTTCTFEDDANFVPDSCVGDGTDDDVPESADVVLAGDVDGNFDANDLDETAVETELESVLDAADLQGDIALTTDTSGNYVQSVADGTGIDGTAAGEGATYTPTFDATEIDSATWGAGSFTAFTFNAGATDPVLTLGSASVTWSAVTTWNLDDEGEIRLFEEDAGGTNYKGFKSPAAVTANTTCTFEDDANFIPDSCVGDGTDDDVPESADVVLAGDVDGNFDANDIDESAVETELESVLDAADLQGDIALTTDTSGNYVQSVADGTGIDGTASGEGATYTPTFDATEIDSATWGAGSFTTFTFNSGATDPTITFGSATMTIEAITSLRQADASNAGGTIRLLEDPGTGSNYISLLAPAAITSDVTCTLENDANPIPDSCVGDGTDDGAGGGITGPGSSTDNAMVRWDGTGGSAVQNSTFQFSDTGNIDHWADLAGGDPDYNIWNAGADDIDIEFIFTKTRHATDPFGNGVLSGGDDIGSVYFKGNDGNSTENFARIYGQAASWNSETIGDGDTPGELIFDTVSDASATLEERLRINAEANTQVIITSGDDGSTVGPNLTLFRDSSSAADSDGMGSIFFKGRDDGGGFQSYGGFYYVAQDTGAGSEDSYIAIENMQAGVGTEVLRMQSDGTIWSRQDTVNVELYQFVGSADGTDIIGLHSRNTTIGSHTAIQSGDETLMITGMGSDGDQFINQARIGFIADAAPGDNDMPGSIRMYTTADGASSLTERFRISNFGGLGIAGANFGTDNQSLISTGSTTAPAWETIVGKRAMWIPGGSFVPRVTNGCIVKDMELATNDIMVRSCDYDAATEEGAGFTVKMPDTWDEGTVTARFVWTHPATATNFGVVWGVACLATSNDDAMDAALGTQVTVTDTGGTTSDQYTSDETSAATCSGSPAAGDTVYFEAERVAANGSDTLAVDAYLLGVTIYYTENSFVEP